MRKLVTFVLVLSVGGSMLLIERVERRLWG